MDALSACYTETDWEAGVACFEEGIAAGTIDPLYVSLPLRYPECGAAEAYWGSAYTMADDEYVAMVEATSPCFLALVASGEVDLWEVPMEFIEPSCLEGTNWYTNDDPAFSDRFIDCTSKARTELEG
jgi:hypothetical protein